MRLLVSVRSADEALAAVAGGADIVDAKEPGRGPLGAVDLQVLRDIVDVLPAAVPVSAALGDFHAGDEAARAVREASALLAPRRVPGFLKLGFHGVARATEVERILAAAVAAARSGNVGVIAVAYAEGRAAGAPDPFEVASAAAASGAAGCLLDTWTKDGRRLPDLLPTAEVRRWVEAVRAAGLLAAVAGGLDAGALRGLRDCGADIVGVRGAACDSGRGGRVEAARVGALKAVIGPATWDRAPVPFVTLSEARGA
jgi:uncharacterized protein (UPF0264 family)